MGKHVDGKRMIGSGFLEIGLAELRARLGPVNPHA